MDSDPVLQGETDNPAIDDAYEKDGDGSECVTEVTPTSIGIANADDSDRVLSAVEGMEPSHLVEAGTASMEKSSKQLTCENQQFKLLMELSIHDDDEEERWGNDESRFSNSIEETGTNNSGQWIKTALVIPKPIGM